MLCEQIPELEIVKAFNNPEKLLTEISNLDFDLCITDIEMPKISGMELAGVLQNKLIIFTTAYKDYAVEAFNIDAVDYITKPFTKERLQKAVLKALEQCSKPTLVQKHVHLNTDKGKSLLYLHQIQYIKTALSDSRDKEVTLSNNTIIILKNISFNSLIDLLPKSDFCRVNKKEIIAIKAVKFFNHNEITLHYQKEGKFITLNLNQTYRNDFLALLKT